jgi:S1-C subfamily serine protease
MNLHGPSNQPREEAKTAAEPLTERASHTLSRFYARFQNLVLVLIGVLASLLGMFLYSLTQVPVQRFTQDNINAAVNTALETAKPKPPFSARAYEIISPSLVRVGTFASENESLTENGLGTGFVIDDSGLILTCLHVVGDSVNVRVRFADGSESGATVIVRKPENDLAVLRPDQVPDDLVPAVLASSDSLQIGDEVFAAGNPFGLSNSLSAGVVSGLKRSFKFKDTGEELRNLVQFDAAVNPGNSGGPLVNRDGEVVGVVTALMNPTRQDVFIGIGFAVPIETAATAAGAPPF